MRPLLLSRPSGFLLTSACQYLRWIATKFWDNYFIRRLAIFCRPPQFSPGIFPGHMFTLSEFDEVTQPRLRGVEVLASLQREEASWQM